MLAAINIVNPLVPSWREKLAGPAKCVDCNPPQFGLQGPKKSIACHGTEIGFYLHQSKGVDWVFVDHPSYPRPGGIYADQFGAYGDNQVCLLCPPICA